MNGMTDTAGALPAGSRDVPRAGWKAFAALWAMQGLVAFVLLREFLDGTSYFAYLDIGADTYEIFTGYAVHLATLWAREGFTTWTFGSGWGAPITFMLGDQFRLLAMAAGPEHVQALRIWVYVLKIVLGGTFFLLMIRPLVQSTEAAVIAALAYSFCGYIATNGQWDSETLVFVFFPLILWAIGRYLRTGDLVSLPLSVGAALLFALFSVTLAASLAIAFAVMVAASDDPRGMARRWITGVAPLVALGFAIGAPFWLPTLMQLLDSPRISGQASLIDRMLGQALQVTSWPLFREQLGALFHKDLFFIGDMHAGYMNYLESPGFYVGLLPLLAAGQLWGGSRAERRLLVVGVAATLLYFAFPVFRLAGFGFAAPYFRATTLWVTLGLLFLGALGLDRMLRIGVDRRLLVISAAVLAALLALVAWSAPYVWALQVFRSAAFLLVMAALLLAARWPAVRTRLVPALLLLCAIEIVATTWPSYFALRRTASAIEQPVNDVTLPALQAIRRADSSPFYRVEKTFQSMSEADALLQDFYGVRSYYYHGKAVVDFHQNLGLMRQFGAFVPTNRTNWTAAPQDRYFLHSLLGVRYVITKSAIDWPGFEPLASGKDWHAYRNRLALPLGFVQSRQVTRAQMAQMERLPPEQANRLKDAAILNAVVLDAPMPQWGEPYDIGSLASGGLPDAATVYEQPARALQRTGLVIESFRNDRIRGRVSPERPGILVFSIPAYRGWTLEVDGQPTPLITANFGMLAAPVAAGSHVVELRYTLPGLYPGLAAGACGLVLLAALALRRQRTLSRGATRS